MNRTLRLLLCFLPLASGAWGASMVSTSLGAVKVYPNPWRADSHPNSSIKFENLPAASTIKIFTTSAHEVTTLTADSVGQASWDRTNRSGEAVASGIYIFLVIDPAGNNTSGKIAIIK